MATATALYLAYRRDELQDEPSKILRLAARAEWKGDPPEQVVEWLPNGVDAVPGGQQVASKEDAEEQRREQAAENELLPIPSCRFGRRRRSPRVAFWSHIFLDAGGQHYRRQSSRRSFWPQFGLWN